MLFRGWEVLGLGDLWGGDPRGDVARLLPPGTPTVPRLVLAHQPDTAALLPVGSVRLVLSGHTHGGVHRQTENGARVQLKLALRLAG